MHRFVRVLPVVLGLLAISQAEVFTPKDSASLSDFVLAKAGADGLYAARSADAYHGSLALAALADKQPAHASRLCDWTVGSSYTKGGLQRLYQIVKLAAQLGCAARIDAAPAAGQALAAVANASSVDDIYYGIGTLASLHHAKALPKAIGLKEITKAMQPSWAVLKRLIMSSGLVRPQPGTQSSIQATGRAYLLLVEARNELRLQPPSDVEKAVDELVASIPKVLDGATAKGLSAAGDKDWLGGIATFLAGAAAVQAHGLDPLQLGHLARALAATKEVGTLQQAFHLATGLQALKAKSFPQALEITLATPALAIGSETPLRVLVTDFTGRPVTDASVTASSKGGSLLTDASLKSVDSSTGAYELDVLSHVQAPAKLELTVTAVAESGKPAGQVDVRVVVTDELVPSPATITVSGADSDTLQDTSATFPDAAADSTLALDHTSSLKVALGLKAASADAAFTEVQALLRLTHLASGASAFFAPKSAGDDALTITITTAGLAKQIGAHNGAYEATLLAGHETVAAPLVWLLGTVEVTHAPRDDGSPALPPPARAAAAASQALPEIRHIFRQPAARPPQAVSYLFTGLAVAPLAVLLYMLASIGVNFKGFPTEGGPLIANLGFQASILAILVLYVIFWLQLDLLTLLPILAGLLLVATVFGYSALSSHGSSHLKDQ
ncbi:hypothetical protein WJX73_007465 [Symbiochloris irregularis]|uniref:Dolichyl-diphosphooligosaccharide--protein glycosyltransferase subunit 2 n=1 Tax=Symbiochloris irregularis TaxID=706552 RepID=A0AAW1PBS7_9CHLO